MVDCRIAAGAPAVVPGQVAASVEGVVSRQARQPRGADWQKGLMLRDLGGNGAWGDVPGWSRQNLGVAVEIRALKTVRRHGWRDWFNKDDTGGAHGFLKRARRYLGMPDAMDVADECSI